MENLKVYFWSGFFTPENIQEMGEAFPVMWYNKAMKARERGATIYCFELPDVWLQTPERIIDAIAGIETALQERYPDHVAKIKKMLDEKENGR